MNAPRALLNWRLAETPDGNLELVGTLLGRAGDEPIAGFRTGALAGVAGVRLVQAADGTLYRLLPQPQDRQIEPEILNRYFELLRIMDNASSEETSGSIDRSRVLHGGLLQKARHLLFEKRF